MNNKTLIEKIVPLVFSTSYLALFILLTISAANKWNEISQNSFMFAILALSLVAVVYPLIKRERTNLPEKIIVVTCFTLLIIAIIVFASVSDGKYREPVIEISSAVTGGLLALYGIGITIKFNRLEKEKDEIEKAKPNVFPIGEQTWVQLDEKTKIQRDLFVRKDLSDFEEAKKLAEKHNIKLDKFKNTVGHVMNEFYEEFCQKDLIQPTFVYCYPIEVSPLTKKDKDPRFVQRFELFVNGKELANA